MHLYVSSNASSLLQFQRDYEQAIASGADGVEWRLDLLDPSEYDRFQEYEDWLRQRAKHLIITCRSVAQGGRHNGPPADRITRLLEASRFLPQWIDVEFSDHQSPNHFSSASQVLLSAHLPESSPGKVESLLSKMASQSVDGIKLVWPARSVCDSISALDLQRRCKQPASIFCSGDEGIPSRILGRKFGATITYASLRHGDETAAGQLTLDEMLNRYRWKSIDQHTKVFGVIGDPVHHSLGPVVHNAAFDAMKINAVYLPFRVAKESGAFERFLELVDRSPWLDVAGFSMTAPHKESAQKWIGDSLDPLAKRIGAINTLRYGETGWTGTNTDAAAVTSWVCRGLGCSQQELRGVRFDIIGAGGLARAVAVVLRDHGAVVTIHARTIDRAKPWANDFGCSVQPLSDCSRFYGEVLIHCTPVGMEPDLQSSLIQREQLSTRTMVFDSIYCPRRTRLLELAEQAGCRTINGLPLFLEQAALQFEFWTAQPAPREIMLRAAMDASFPDGQNNIILIGSRGSGKTTVGRLLAQRLGWEFVDTDQAIQQQQHRTIAEIFAEYGEEHFRKVECDVIASMSRFRHMVIAAGGGAVENIQNRRQLAQLGRVVWLNADCDELHRRILNDPASVPTRPPLSSHDLKNEIELTLSQRTPHYQSMADVTIDTTQHSPAEVVNKILDHFAGAHA